MGAPRDRIRTVIIHATSVPTGWPRVAVDTVRGRLALDWSWVPASWRRRRGVRFVLGNEYERLSYIVDWREAWSANPRLDVTLLDVNDEVAMLAAGRRIRSADLVVVLHSAAGDNLRRVRRLEGRLAARRGPLVVFFGNEFAGMREKIAFANATGAEFIGSQLSPAAGQWLYEETGATVLHAPQALNPAIYRPLGIPRTIDVGFRGDLYEHAFALGDLERTRILERFRTGALDLGISVDMEYQRVERRAWNLLLNRWNGIVGAESGTYFLERDDHTRDAVVAHLQEHPEATFDEVYERFFRDLKPLVSGKTVSSRHFEPAGSLTCQLLLEGDYSGALVAGEHYLPIARDHSNLGEVIAALRDPRRRRELTEAARQHVMERHTYDRRVESVVEAVSRRREATVQARVDSGAAFEARDRTG